MDQRNDFQIIRDFGKPGSPYRNTYPTLGQVWDKVYRPSLSKEFGRGLDRGVDLTKGMGYGLLGYGADLMGAEGLRKDMVRGYQQSLRKASLKRSTIDFTGAMNTGDFDDYLQWAAGGAGELLPNIAVTIGGALLGGGVGALVAGGSRQALFKSANKVVGRKLVDNVRKQLGEEGAERLLMGTIDKLKVPLSASGLSSLRGYGAMSAFRTPAHFGAQTGGMTAGIGLNLGEVYGGITGDTDVDQSNVTREERLVIGGVGGVAAGLLDFLGPNLLLNRIFKGRRSTADVAGRINRAFTALGSHMVVEGVTEGAQEAIAEWAKLIADEDKEFDAEAFKHHVTEAVALGSLAGFGFGTAGGTVEFMRAPPKPPSLEVTRPTGFADELDVLPAASLDARILELNETTKLEAQYMEFIRLQRKVVNLTRSQGRDRHTVEVLTEGEQEQYTKLQAALAATAGQKQDYSRFLQWQSWIGHPENQTDGTVKYKDSVKAYSVGSWETEGTAMNSRRSAPIEFSPATQPATPHPASDQPRSWKYMRIPSVTTDLKDPGVRLLPVSTTEYEAIVRDPIPALNKGVEMIEETEVKDGVAVPTGRRALLNPRRVKGESWASPTRFDKAPEVTATPGGGSSTTVTGATTHMGVVKYASSDDQGNLILPMTLQEFEGGLSDPNSAASFIASQIAQDGRVISYSNLSPSDSPAVTSEGAMNHAIFGSVVPPSTLVDAKKQLALAMLSGKPRVFPEWVIKSYYNTFVGKDPPVSGDVSAVGILGGQAAWEKNNNSKTVKIKFSNGTTTNLGWAKLSKVWFPTGLAQDVFQDSMWTSFIGKLRDALQTDVNENPTRFKDKSEVHGHLMSPTEGTHVANFWNTGGIHVGSLPAHRAKAVRDLLEADDRPRSLSEQVMEDLRKTPEFLQKQFINSLTHLSEEQREELLVSVRTGTATAAEFLFEATGTAEGSFTGVEAEYTKGHLADLNKEPAYAKASERHQIALERWTKAKQGEDPDGNAATPALVIELQDEVTRAHLEKLMFEDLHLRRQLGKLDGTNFMNFMHDLWFGVGFDIDGSSGRPTADERVGATNGKGETVVAYPHHIAIKEQSQFEAGLINERSRFSILEILMEDPERRSQVENLRDQMVYHQSLAGRQQQVQQELEALQQQEGVSYSKASLLAKWTRYIQTPKLHNTQAFVLYNQMFQNALRQGDNSKATPTEYADSVEQWVQFADLLVERGLLQEVHEMTPEDAAVSRSAFDSFITDVFDSLRDAGMSAAEELNLTDALEKGNSLPTFVSKWRKSTHSKGFNLEEGPLYLPLEETTIDEDETSPTFGQPIKVPINEAVYDVGHFGSQSQLTVIRDDTGSLVYEDPISTLEALYTGRNLIEVQSKEVVRSFENLDDGSYRAWRFDALESELAKAFSEKTLIDKFRKVETWEEFIQEKGEGGRKGKGSKTAVLAWDALYGTYRLKSIYRSSTPTTFAGGKFHVPEAVQKKIKAGDPLTELEQFQLAEIEARQERLEEQLVLQDQLDKTPDAEPIVKARLSKKINEIQMDLDASDFWAVATATRTEAVKRVMDLVKGSVRARKEIEKNLEPLRNKKKLTPSEEGLKTMYEAKLLALDNLPQFEEADLDGLTEEMLRDAVRLGSGENAFMDEDGAYSDVTPSVRGLWDSIRASDYDPAEFFSHGGKTYNLPLDGGKIQPQFLALAQTIRNYNSLISVIETAEDILINLDIEPGKTTRQETTVTRPTTFIPVRRGNPDMEAIRDLKRNVSQSQLLKSYQVGRMWEKSDKVWREVSEHHETLEDAELALERTKQQRDELHDKLTALQQTINEGLARKPQRSESAADWTLVELIDELKKMFTDIQYIEPSSVEIPVYEEGKLVGTRMESTKAEHTGREGLLKEVIPTLNDLSAKAISDKLSASSKAFQAFWLGERIEISMAKDVAKLAEMKWGSPDWSTRTIREGRPGDIKTVMLSASDFSVAEKEGGFAHPTSTEAYSNLNLAKGAITRAYKATGTDRWVIEERAGGKYAVYGLSEDASIKVQKETHPNLSIKTNLGKLHAAKHIWYNDKGDTVTVALRARMSEDGRETDVDGPGIFDVARGPLFDFRDVLERQYNDKHGMSGVGISITNRAIDGVFHYLKMQGNVALMQAELFSFSQAIEKGVQDIDTRVVRRVPVKAAAAMDEYQKVLQELRASEAEVLNQHTGTFARVPIKTSTGESVLATLMEEKIADKPTYPAIQKVLGRNWDDGITAEEALSLTSEVDNELSHIKAQLADFLNQNAHKSKLNSDSSEDVSSNTFDVIFRGRGGVKPRSSYLRTQGLAGEGVSLRTLLLDAGYDPRLVSSEGPRPYSTDGKRRTSGAKAGRLRNLFRHMQVRGVVELQVAADLDLQLSEDQVNRLVGDVTKDNSPRGSRDWLMKFQSALSAESITIDGQTVANPFLQTKNGQASIARDLLGAMSEVAKRMETQQNLSTGGASSFQLNRDQGESDAEFEFRKNQMKSQQFDRNDFKAFLFSIPGIRDDSTKGRKQEFGPKFNSLFLDAQNMSQGNRLQALNSLLVSNFLRKRNGLYFGLLTEDQMEKILDLPKAPTERTGFSKHGGVDVKQRGHRYRADILALRLSEALGLSADYETSDTYRELWGITPEYLLEKLGIQLGNEETFADSRYSKYLKNSDPDLFRYREGDAIVPEKKALLHWLNKRVSRDVDAVFNFDTFSTTIKGNKRSWKIVTSAKALEELLTAAGNLKAKYKNVTPLLLTKGHIESLKVAENLEFVHRRSKTYVPIAKRTAHQKGGADSLVSQLRNNQYILWRDAHLDEGDASKLTVKERQEVQDENTQLLDEVKELDDLHANYEIAKNNVTTVQGQVWSIRETAPYRDRVTGKMIDPKALKATYNVLLAEYESERAKKAKAIYEWTQEALYDWVNRSGFSGHKNLTGGRYAAQSLEELIAVAGSAGEAAASAGLATDSQVAQIFSQAQSPDLFAEDAQGRTEHVEELLSHFGDAAALEAAEGDVTLEEVLNPEYAPEEQEEESVFDVFPQRLVEDLYQEAKEGGMLIIGKGNKGLHDAKSKIKNFLSGSKTALLYRNPYRDYVLRAVKDIFIASYGSVEGMMKALDFRAISGRGDATYNREALVKLLRIEQEVVNSYADFFAEALSESRRSIVIGESQTQYERAVKNFGLSPSFLDLDSADAVTGVVLGQLNHLLSDSRNLNATKIFDAIYLLEGKKFHRAYEDQLVALESLREAQSHKLGVVGGVTHDPTGQELAEAEALAQEDEVRIDTNARETFLGRMRVETPLNSLSRYSAVLAEGNGEETAMAEFMVRETQKELRALRQEIGKLIGPLNIPAMQARLDIWTEAHAELMRQRKQASTAAKRSIDRKISELGSKPPAPRARAGGLGGEGFATRTVEAGIYGPGKPYDLVPEAGIDWGSQAERLERLRAVRKETIKKLEELKGYNRKLGSMPQFTVDWFKGTGAITMADIIKYHFPDFFTEISWQPSHTYTQYGWESPVSASEIVVGDTRTIVMAPVMSIPQPDGSVMKAPDLDNASPPMQWWRFRQTIESGYHTWTAQEDAVEGMSSAQIMAEGKIPGRMPLEGEWAAWDSDKPASQWIPVSGSEPVAVEGLGEIIPDEFWLDPGFSQPEVSTLVWEGPMLGLGGAMEGIVGTDRDGNKMTDVVIAPDGSIMQGGPNRMVRSTEEGTPDFVPSYTGTGTDGLAQFFSNIVFEGKPLASRAEKTQFISEYELVDKNNNPAVNTLAPAHVLNRLRENEIARYSKELVELIKLETALVTEANTPERQGTNFRDRETLEEELKNNQLLQQEKVQARKDVRTMLAQATNVTKRTTLGKWLIDWEGVNNAGWFLGKAHLSSEGDLTFTSSLRKYAVLLPSGGQLVYTDRLTLVNHEFTDEEEAYYQFGQLMGPLGRYRKRVADTKMFRELEVLGGKGLLLETEKGQRIAEAVEEYKKASDVYSRARRLLEDNWKTKSAGRAQKLFEERNADLDRSSRMMDQSREKLVSLTREMPEGIDLPTDSTWLSNTDLTADSRDFLSPLDEAFRDAEERQADEELRWYGDLFNYFDSWLPSSELIEHDSENRVAGPTTTLAKLGSNPDAVISEMALKSMEFMGDTLPATPEILRGILEGLPTEDVVGIIEEFQDAVTLRYNQPAMPEAFQGFASQFKRIAPSLIWKHLQVATDRTDFGSRVLRELQDPTTEQQTRAANINFGPKVKISFFDPVRGWVHPDGTIEAPEKGLGAEATRAVVEGTSFMDAEVFAAMEEVRMSEEIPHLRADGIIVGHAKKTDGATFLKALKRGKGKEGVNAKLAERYRNFLLKLTDLSGGKLLQDIKVYVTSEADFINKDHTSAGLAGLGAGWQIVATNEDSYEYGVHEMLHHVMFNLKSIGSTEGQELQNEWREMYYRAEAMYHKDRERSGWFSESHVEGTTLRTVWKHDSTQQTMGDAEYSAFVRVRESLESAFGSIEIERNQDELFSYLLTNPDVMMYFLGKKGHKRISMWDEFFDIVIEWLKKVARGLGLNVEVNSLAEEALSIANDITRLVVDNSATVRPPHYANPTLVALRNANIIPDTSALGDVADDVPENHNSSLVKLAIHRRDIGHVVDIAEKAGLPQGLIYETLRMTGKRDPRTQIPIELQTPHFSTRGLEDTAYVDGDMSTANNDKAIDELHDSWSWRLSKLVDRFVEDKDAVEALRHEVDNLTDELELIHTPARLDAEALLKSLSKRIREVIKVAKLEGSLEAISRGSTTLMELRQMLIIEEGMSSKDLSEFMSATLEELAKLDNVKSMSWPRSIGKHFHAMAQLAVDWDLSTLVDIRAAIEGFSTDTGYDSLNSDEKVEVAASLNELNGNPKLRAALSAVAKQNSKIMNMFNVRIMKNAEAQKKFRTRIENLQDGTEDPSEVRAELIGDAKVRSLKQHEKLILQYTNASKERAKLSKKLDDTEQFMEVYEKVILLVNEVEKEYANRMGTLPQFTMIESEGSYGRYYVFKPERVKDNEPVQIMMGEDDTWVPMKSRPEVMEAHKRWKATNKGASWANSSAFAQLAGMHEVDLDLAKDPVKREKFLKHVQYNTVWLRENEHLKNTQLYRGVQNMNDQLTQLNLRKNLFEVRGDWLGKTLEAPLQTLARAGSPYANDIRRRLLLYQDIMLKHTPQGLVHSGKLQKKFRDAAYLAGYEHDWQAFDDEILTPIEVMLNRSPHISSLEGAMKEAHKVYSKKIRLRDGSVSIDENQKVTSSRSDLTPFEAAFSDLLVYSKIGGSWFNEVRDDLGIGVERRGSYMTDDITGQTTPMIGRAVEKGFYTTALRLARLRVFNDFKLLEETSTPFVKLIEQDTEALLAEPNLAATLTPDVVDILIRPLFTEFEILRPFGNIDWSGEITTPARIENGPDEIKSVPQFLVESGINPTQAASISSLRELFEVMIPGEVESEQVLHFLNTVAGLIDQDVALEDKSTNERRGTVWNKLKRQFSDLKSLKINAEINEDSNVFNPGAGHFIIDARTNPWIPAKYYSRANMDHIGMTNNVKKLAITAAFGRDAKDAEKLFQKLLAEMDSRLLKKQQDLGSHHQETVKFEKFHRAIAHKTDGVRGRLNRIFNSSQGELADIPAFMEMLGLVVQGTLSGPRSWLVQTQGQTILPFFMGGWTKQSRKTLVESFKTFGKSIFNDWGKMLGSDLTALSKEEQYLKDLIFQSQFEELDWSEYEGSDTGYQYAYQRKKFGFNIQRIARLIGRRLNKGVALLPWNGFKVWSKTTTLGNAIGMMKTYVDAARTLANYFKANPDVANNPAFSIIDEPRLLKKLYGKNPRGVQFLAIRGVDYLGKTMDEVARDIIRRGERGEGFLDEGMLRGFLMMSQNEVTGDGSINSRPYWTKTNEIGRLAGTITGWSLWQTTKFTETGRDNQEKIKWAWFLANLGLTALPISIAWGLTLDFYDEKFRGRAPYRRRFSSDLSAWKNVQSAIDYVDASGSMGQWGSIMNGMANYTDPRRSMGRGVGLERVFVWSVLANAYRSLHRGVLQGGFDWQTVTRGVPGLTGAMQWLQVTNQLATSLGMPPLSAAEEALTNKLNAKRHLLAAGEQLGLELKAPYGGIPTPQSYYTSLMYRAALEDNPESFREFYMSALSRYGEVTETPKDSLMKSWKTRHPLRNIFRFTPDASTKDRIFRLMTSDGKKSVNQALRLFEKYDKLINSYQ